MKKPIFYTKHVKADLNFDKNLLRKLINYLNLGGYFN